MKRLQVVCMLCVREGKVFLCKRPLTKSNGGMWEFPGGKIGSQESEIDALKREIREELGVTVTKANFFMKSFHRTKAVEIELTAYLVTLTHFNFTLFEHEAFIWASKKELMNYNLSPADIPIAQTWIKNEAGRS